MTITTNIDVRVSWPWIYTQGMPCSVSQGCHLFRSILCAAQLVWLAAALAWWGLGVWKKVDQSSSRSSFQTNQTLSSISSKSNTIHYIPMHLASRKLGRPKAVMLLAMRLTPRASGMRSNWWIQKLFKTWGVGKPIDFIPGRYSYWPEFVTFLLDFKPGGYLFWLCYFHHQPILIPVYFLHQSGMEWLGGCLNSISWIWGWPRVGPGLYVFKLGPNPPRWIHDWLLVPS